MHRWGQGKIHHSAERLIPSLLELLLLKVAAPRENLLVHVEHTDRVGNDAEEVGRHAAVQRLDALFPEDELEALGESVVLWRLAGLHRLS